MVIIGKPHNPRDYFVANGDLALRIHAAGFTPRFNNDGELYFCLTQELVQWLEDNGIAG